MNYLVTIKSHKLLVAVEEKDISHLYRTQQIFLQQASVTCSVCQVKIFKLGASKRNAIEQLLKHLGFKGKFNIVAQPRQQAMRPYICSSCIQKDIAVV